MKEASGHPHCSESEAQMSEAREWYAKTFGEAADADSLPIPEAGLESSGVVNKSYALSVSNDKVHSIAQRFGVPESVAMQTAWSLLLAAYSAEEKASYCTACCGQAGDASDETVRTVPVYANWSSKSSAMTLHELMASLDEQLQQACGYMHYAYQDAVQDLGLNNQVLFVCQGSAPVDGSEQDQVWRLCAELLESEGAYALRMTYSAADYTDAFMHELAKTFSTILCSMAGAETVKDINYCDAEQVRWLDEQNPKAEQRNAVQHDQDDSLVKRFKQHVAAQPDAICIVSGDVRLTYAEVDRLSDTIDPQYTVRCGEHVIGYSVPRNEQMVIVPLSIAKAGMTAMPLDSSYPAERLEFMRSDATQYDGEDAFILLYTSGTTGIPKGVMLSEQNILSFCDFHVRHIGLTPESRYATYAGYGFDAFMHDMWGCLCAGCAMYVIGDDIRFDLEELYKYFVKEGITHVFMTTQMATQMVINYPEIPALQYLGTGGEKMMSMNPPSYKLLNAYGPTECTVYVSSFWVEKNEPNIPIGYPNDTADLYIANKCGKRLPWGAAGELLVAGPQVGIGYLNQPEKTADAFVSFSPKDGFVSAGDNCLRVYRTGDIVRYRKDGAIEFVGRKDGQVKIRGFRIELKEVEAVIRQFDGIKDATVQAFDYPDGGGKFIAAYIVSDRKIDIRALDAFIMDQKPPYMVPAVTMQIDAIPLNQNQKVNKRALPEPKVQNAGAEESQEAAPLNVLEEQLKQIITGILGNSDFGITTDLRYVGLSSIAAIKLATQVYKRFGVQLDAKPLIKGATLQLIENEILKALMSSEGKSQEPSRGVEEKNEVTRCPLSYSQTGVYFECLKNPTSTLYNVPLCIQLPKQTPTEALRDAVQKAVVNHPALFMHFITGESETEQTLDTEALEKAGSKGFDIPERTLTESELESYKHEFVRPFNLTRDMLFRFEIVRTDNAVYLLSDIHHLVCDGASYDVFIHEICDLLDGKTIEPEMCSYTQFVAEQQEAEKSKEFAEAEAFFRSRLGEVEDVTEIPSDLANPKQQGENGRVIVPLDMEQVEKLAHSEGVNPSAVVLSAVFYALARFSNSPDVCITTISNGRSNLRVAGTMGMFVNTLALTSKIGSQTIREFLRENADTFDTTLMHENYPFARIAADYNLKADIMFAYQMGVLSDYRVFGQKVLADETMELNVPKFKIAFYIMPVDGIPSIAVEYDNGQYSEALIRNLAQSVCNAVKAFGADTLAQITSVSMLNSEQIAVLDSFNQTKVDYDDTQTVISLFKEQVRKTPDNIAVIFRDKRITYRALDEMTDRIAAALHPTTNVIAIKVERSEWMVVGALSVMKAGCAYMPLDPTYPEERLQYMQQDGNSCMLLTEKELEELSAAGGQPSVSVSGIKPSDLFILLYTSGSTGVPKGVMLEHRNLVAFCHWYHRYYDLQPTDKVAAYASFGFDACMMDLYPALTCGAAVCIVPEDLRLNLPDLNAYFNEEGITHSFMTTQVGCQFAMNCDNHSLKHLSVGGEKVLPITPPTNYTFHNGYGPTECTIFTTTYPMHEFEQNTPIGKPLDNLQLFVVDKELNRLPIGAMGELLVSGPQVGRGYLNLPEKTAETFITFSAGGSLRAYRTGDIVRYLPDGNIQFVGRRDGQVKIRGFRIELKEVEAVIREYEGIKDATVQAFDYPNGGKYIAAYIVSDDKIDIAALNSFIKERKPPYMVPAATMQIDTIPLNQNQKVNRKALPAPQLQAETHDYVEPVNDLEKMFCEIFASILSLDKVGATDNFFELGGTSLMVTRVVIEADKAGHHVAYGDIFNHPTPRLLAQFVGGEVATEQTHDTDVEQFDYSGIDAILQRNNIDMFLSGEKQSLGNVLLTGATGYLGIHVLRELIDSDAQTITCLVRGKDQHDAERRVRNLLFYYFSRRFDELFGKRLFVVNGDVTSDFSSQLSAVSIQTVFNCAANVKHFSKTDDIEQVNVGGAERCVEFCLATGARLVHISTTSVGEIWLDREDGKAIPLLTERKLYFGQFLDNRYVHSKFLAERIILDAVAHHGLNAKVMRVGNLAARSYDGEFQANFQSNSYMGRIKVFAILGCCPFEEYDTPTEFSPIDQTAKAVVLLASTPKECTVFQPFNNHTDLLGDILLGLEKVGNPIRFVEPEEFQQAISEQSQDPEKAKLMSALLAYQDMTHGHKACTIERDNRYTCAVLHRMGFRWSEPDSAYISRMLTAISGLGFFEV